MQSFEFDIIFLIPLKNTRTCV